MAEWFKAPVLKTGVPARVPWVRIPPLPPELFEIIDLFLISKSCAQFNVQSACGCFGTFESIALLTTAAVVAALAVIAGAIVSISAKVNKLGSSIDDLERLWRGAGG